MGARPRERRARRRVRRHGLFAGALGLAFVFLPGAASLAEDATIEAAGGVYGYYWSPSSAQVAPGGAVAFKSPSGSVPHGVTWSGGPETPTCSNVPVAGKTSWSGSCSFAQAGSYSFYCTVHPTEMKGTITASASVAPNPNPNPPPPGYPDPPQSVGPLLKGLTVARNQRGSAVRGSVELSREGAGSRLRVELLASRALLLGPGHSGVMSVGKLVRSSLQAGRSSFSVSLKRSAREALRLAERLSLTVRVTVSPPGGDALKRTRTVILHG